MGFWVGNAVGESVTFANEGVCVGLVGFVVGALDVGLCVGDSVGGKLSISTNLRFVRKSAPKGLVLFA